MFSKSRDVVPETPHVSCSECGVLVLKDKAKKVTQSWNSGWYFGPEVTFYCDRHAPKHTRIDGYGNCYAEFKVESNGYPEGYVLSEHYRFAIAQSQDLGRQLEERDREINQLRTQFGVGLNVDC